MDLYSPCSMPSKIKENIIAKISKNRQTFSFVDSILDTHTNTNILYCSKMQN